MLALVSSPDLDAVYTLNKLLLWCLASLQFDRPCVSLLWHVLYLLELYLLPSYENGVVVLGVTQGIYKTFAHSIR